MNNKRQGSRTQMVRHSAHLFPVPGTIPPPSRQFREEAAAQRFAQMARAALDQVGIKVGGGEATPCCGAGVFAAPQHGVAEAQPHSSRDKPSRDDVVPVRPPRSQQAPLRASYAPKVRVVPGSSAPVLPLLADLLDLNALRPTRGRGAGSEGAGALARVLDELARHVLRVRPYKQRGDAYRQVVLHLSAEMLAAALERNDATVWRWTQTLEASGYLHARPHYTTSTNQAGERVTRVDGTLYAVRLQPGHRARLDYQDLTRQYRDLDADRAAGRTAHRAIATIERLEQDERQQMGAAELGRNLNYLDVLPDDKNKMQGSTDTLLTTSRYIHALKQWAVTPGQIDIPLKTDPCIIGAEGLKGVQDVVYLLSTVFEAHPIKRGVLVDLLSATLARALDDEHSQAFYAKAIWQAYRASAEGRAGLQVLAAQLARLDVDCREWAGLRRPAALLAARLRAA